MKRKITPKVREEVFDRDMGCVVCGRSTDIENHPHHAYYGLDANYWANRNDLDQLVMVCRFCHHEIHHGTKWFCQEYREKCKDYLKNYYDPSIPNTKTL